MEGALNTQQPELITRQSSLKRGRLVFVYDIPSDFSG